jgi:hypothetical protein
MGDEFYLDYAGTGSAAARFASRSTEMSNAAADGAEASVTGMQGPMGGPTAPVQSAADEVLIALGGRLRAFSAELAALSKLVGDTITVANQIDVEYKL